MRKHSQTTLWQLIESCDEKALQKYIMIVDRQLQGTSMTIKIT